jgi:hypothetical protein
MDCRAIKQGFVVLRQFLHKKESKRFVLTPTASLFNSDPLNEEGYTLTRPDTATFIVTALTTSNLIYTR